MICPNPLCGRGVLVDGCCLLCGYGFKAVKRPRRRKIAKPKPEVKDPWWAK